MLKLLLRTYPISTKRDWRAASLWAGCIVFFILFLLQPFGLSNYEGNKLLVSLSFAAVSMIITLLYGLLIGLPWSKSVSVWHVWQEGLSIFLLIFCVAIGNFFLDHIIFHYPFSISHLLAYIYATLTIGVIITFLLTVLGYQKRLHSQLDQLLQKNSEEQQCLMLTFHDSSVRGDDFTLPANDFLYAEAQKNYVDIYYQTENGTAKREVRSTLTAVVADAAQPNIFQCHRSFIVNLNNITSATGNSNGYQLTLGNDSRKIPVSRSYVPKLKSFIK
ncbi:MAG: LytTR family DNA-binding domain-containing protein [Prevotella sp.]|jgi:two-component system LytT family response regulator